MEENLTQGRTRTPGRRYPGASLTDVLTALQCLEAAGGSISIGLLATRLDMSEGGSPFKRLLASARSYGLIEDYPGRTNVVRLTDDGEAALDANDAARRHAALRRGLVRPDIFAEVARDLVGRQLPDNEALADRFQSAGVAPSGAALAATNFVDSATEAGAVTSEGERRILADDLPFETTALESEAASASPPPPGQAGDGRRERRPGERAPAKAPDGLKIKVPEASQGLSVTVQLDVSAWDVDQVVELFEKLRGPRT